MSQGSKDATASNQGKITQGQRLAEAINWVLTDTLFIQVALHGNTTWCALDLVRVALLWVWSSNRKMVEAADEAIEDAEKLFGTRNINSYQTLINGLKRYSGQILAVLLPRLHQLMKRVDPAKFRIGIWLVLAVDGSRISTCRTEANEKRFCKPRSSYTKKQKKDKKKKKNKRGRTAQKKKPASKKKNYDPQPVGPQVWLTLLWHVGLRMPWAWKIGPSYSSERGHLLELLKSHEFPEDTLICGDAGFVGYDFWNTVNEAGLRFLVRVGSNCKFLKRLGHVREKNGIVYCWPLDMQSRKQPPLVFRLMKFHDGKGEVYVVTNELNERKLTGSQASQIYRKRWGVEVQFRALKQTYDRSKLLGRTPDVVEQELSWSIVGLWMMQLLAHRDQVDRIEPESKTSIALVIAVIQGILRRPDKVPKRGESLQSQLSGAVTDTYERKGKKKSRNYPRRKEEPRTGPPQVRVATAMERKLNQRLESLQNAT